MMILALKLILAHFIGDFVLQPAHWVEDKLEKKGRSKYLYFHIGVHLLALLIILQFQHILPILVIVVTHFLIDLGKLSLTNAKNYRWLFVLDQVLHLLVLGAVLYWIEPFPLDFSNLLTENTLLLITFLVFVTYVSGIIMRMLLAPYIDEIAKNDVSEEGGSLKNAGTYIGMLERLFVFGFILMQQWAAIGLLIAAKSVFRFGDLNKGKNRKLTEYVLIGTLLSFGLAILSGTFYMYLAEQL
ncbi:DUF3307 domain-containing protein [Flagellimonas marinaquae]|uniref:DUF3307 domain-containing protein n=1 Tax=Flagellimonas aurea TaxID=2915619 RepID=A0ABS3GA23_9FLAO|nr:MULTISPECIES: DUF3307 domain-containing protein [Allomuricauda]MAO18163.1 hypothetical protein [Allomuricauda sp.]MBO0355422.1 DUF3307 domain-containing protein [Allomuricauda aurea]UBZ15223.1 DUF3307 domain-containing protein [Allomuricauda aquimarina]|tara:strand:- start:189 stop:914 length:726 start_codon:yes stop_codon:yes gene_type:complete